MASGEKKKIPVNIESEIGVLELKPKNALAALPPASSNNLHCLEIITGVDLFHIPLEIMCILSKRFSSLCFTFHPSTHPQTK